MNQRTQRLLAALEKQNDAEGAMALARLIGQYGIGHAFELDVYAAGGRHEFPRVLTARRARTGSKRKTSIPAPREIGLKDEEAGFAQLRSQRVRVRKLHNALINRFKNALEWKYKLVQSEFDVLIGGWHTTRTLLVEAKTGTTGSAGRTQLRQAIGQLYDYRWRSFGEDCRYIDLALLVPNKPAPEVIELLKILKIEVFWFEGRALKATTRF